MNYDGPAERAQLQQHHNGHHLQAEGCAPQVSRRYTHPHIRASGRPPERKYKSFEDTGC